MTLSTTSVSATGTQIFLNANDSTHTILQGVAVESTSAPAADFSAVNTSLTVAGHLISPNNFFTIVVRPTADVAFVNITASGTVSGGGILINQGSGSVYFINAGVAMGTDIGYIGSSAVDTISNSGVMVTVTGQSVVNAGPGDDRVFNSGVLQGNVLLGLDDDRYTGTGTGVVNGTVLGQDGNDTLRGSDEADLLDGGTNNDLLSGRGGNDTLLGGNSPDTILGGDGDDDIDGGNQPDVINGNAGDDTITGGTGDDVIRGGRDDDVIDGFTGDDTIRGDSGDDRIIGGDGRDDMFGGGGQDVFVFEDANDSGVGGTRDRIFDFQSGTDTLDISQIVGPAFTFVGSGPFSASGSPEVRAVSLAAGTLIYIDSNGDGHRNSDIFLIGTSSVSEGDFLL